MEDTAAPASSSPAPAGAQPPVRRRRWRRVVAWLLLTPPALIALFLVAVGIWVSTDTSLATALARANGYLPEGYALQAEGVRGSLRQGGHIDHLRYDAKGLVVDALDVDLAWRPAALLDRLLQLDQVKVKTLTITDTRPPNPTALQELVLPLTLDIRFAVQQLQWVGPLAVQASMLTGRYRYTGSQHQLALEQARYADGQYQGQATLDAQAPMALKASLQAQFEATVPGSPRAWPLAARASAQGNLAGHDAELALQADVQSAPLPAGAASGQAGARHQAKPREVTGGMAVAPAQPTVQAQLAARIRPWTAQPVVQASAQLQQFDLALLWPQAPRTMLSGTLAVQPQTPVGGWQAQADLRNDAAGPWDQGRLPVDSLKARAQYREQAWAIESAQAGVAAGQVSVSGDVRGRLWTGAAQLRGVDPHALHTRLAPARVDGSLNAHSTAQSASTVDFDTRLQPSAQQGAASALQGLHLKSGSASGIYQSGLLTLRTLNLQTADATLQGRLAVRTTGPLGLDGALQLALPGARASAQGKLAALDGGGELTLDVTDAALAQRWLASLPGLTAGMVGPPVRGQGKLVAQWQGGWQVAPGGGGKAGATRVQATLDWPVLDLGDSAEGTRLRALQAQLSGTLAALQLTASGQADTTGGHFALRTQFHGGRDTSGSTWLGQLQTLEVRAANKQQADRTWQGRLRAPVDWRYATAGAGSFSSGTGELQFSGPLAGAPVLAWGPVQWRRADGSQGQQVLSKGRLRDVPLSWLELLANTPLVNLGLRGDVVLDGDWDLNLGQQVQLQATVARRSGDIRLQNDDASRATAGTGANDATISAGLRDARITLQAQGDAVQLKANWDSERAGQAQAEFATRLVYAGGQWTWPQDAPLRGSLRAALPKVGVWSVLAPPGWRIRGTLDAALELQGTRAAPQWQGTLNADDLALRSVVQGLELSGGKLRSRLNGLRLELQEFSLQGAGASAGAGRGGQLTLNGFAQWQLPGAGVPTGAPALAQVRMELNARAQGLRLSTRADRRLAVTGQVQAVLAEQKLQVRGNLKADEAMFILPAENTPSLGDDVVVRGVGVGKATTDNPTSATPRSLSTDVQVTLDLGPALQVVGRGLSTRLAGTLKLTDASAPGVPGNLRVTGEVRAERGGYKAYGQQLDIEEGVLRFTGPYDNPALDILAIRPNISQRVGVQITGTVLSPRVRLYAEPDLPEAEKLAWLVLGRGAASGGTEAVVLQQAALALLGGNGKGLTGGLAEALGLDELSFRGSSTNTDGTTSAAAVTLGKRFSRNFYVAYERSLAGTLGSLYVFYDLSRRFTLRAQTGEQSGVDLIFTVPYD